MTRELQFAQNQTQRIRLQDALQHLQYLSSKTAFPSVNITDTILVNQEDGVLKGHETIEVDGVVIATLCGVVERVNKLVYVRAFRAILGSRVLRSRIRRVHLAVAEEAGLGRVGPAVEDRRPLAAEIAGEPLRPPFLVQIKRETKKMPQELQLALNQPQRIRLQAALQQLQDLSSKTASASVIVTDTIPVNQEDGVLKGHGTTEVDGEVVATLCGVVERVNKLVYVRALRARYKPETGDIIVGRVIEVAQKRWRLEINYSQDAVLMLSSMNLPDGIQRRRTAVDELNMRSIFEESDVICAEVRGSQHDGSLQLQARSQKYGKLERGQLLAVPPYLVKRRKQHFHYLDQYGVDLILGCNGFIWVGEHVEARDSDMAEDQENRSAENGKSTLKLMAFEAQEKPFTPLEIRRHICRIANAVRVLSILGFSLSVEAITDTAETSSSRNLDVKDMLAAEFCVQTAEREVQRRVTLMKRKG